jgi:hypothetical protein
MAYNHSNAMDTNQFVAPAAPAGLTVAEAQDRLRQFGPNRVAAVAYADLSESMPLDTPRQTKVLVFASKRSTTRVPTV